MSSSPPQSLPEGLAALPPGPELGTVLAGIDPWGLTAEDAAVVMVAWHRQTSWCQAGLFGSMVAFGLCRPAPSGAVAHDAEPGEGASDEVRAALVLTRRAAESQFYLAWDLHDRLPEVLEALTGGRIDLPRARVLSDWTRELEPEQATLICLTLLPQAGELTTGELIDRVKQMAVAIDPDWAARRYRQAVRTRRVVGYRTADGTANVSGLDLPVEQAAAACTRIEMLARRVRRGGDVRPIDQVRADLFLGMLDGTFTGWDEQRIIDHFTGRVTDPGGAPDADTDAGPDPDADADPDSAAKARDDVSGARPGDVPDHGDADDPAFDESADAPAGKRPGVPVRPGVELRVRLSTLLGLDRFPAEIAGWGFTHAENARLIAAEQTGGQWRYAVCDDHGALLADGLITARPSGHPRRPRAPGATVEIQIPLALLRRLHDEPHRHRDWSNVIGQITRDLAAQGNGAGQARDGRPGEGRLQPGRDGPDRRFPSKPLRRHVNTRDRRCGFPGCRMPAKDTDIDHVRQWTSGGPTQDHNLTSLCRYDHRLKDEHGWRLACTTDGALRWTSRIGLTYTVRRPPIMIDLPGPASASRGSSSSDDPCPQAQDEHHGPTPIWDGAEGPAEAVGPQPAPGPEAGRPPPLVTDHEPPPF